MPVFVLKTEPSEYSFSDLLREKRCAWTGVTNAAARAHLRTMRAGDLAYIYHTGDEKAIVGLAKVLKAAYGDGTLNGKGEIAAPVIDIAPVKALHPVALATIKSDKRFLTCPLVTIGRLSVLPLTEIEAKAMAELTQA